MRAPTAAQAEEVVNVREDEACRDDVKAQVGRLRRFILISSYGRLRHWTNILGNALLRKRSGGFFVPFLLFVHTLSLRIMAPSTSRTVGSLSAVNIGAPSQSQSSRKGKKAWRKNIDITAEEGRWKYPGRKRGYLGEHRPSPNLRKGLRKYFNRHTGHGC